MKFNPEVHHRRSIRLKEYDYSQPGAYFVTLVTRERANLLGEIIGGEMILNKYGKIVQLTWINLPRHYPLIILDEFVIMPNHVHAIVMIDYPGRGGSKKVSKPAAKITNASKINTPNNEETRPYDNPQLHGLPEIVRGFKSFSARKINILRQSLGVSVWQRNYYEHIVRSQAELERIRLYIADNPCKWAEDQENPQSKSKQNLAWHP